MREQIEKLLHARPFQAFAVDVAEDVAYSIPTNDHVWLGKKVLGIEDDDGDLYGLHGASSPAPLRALSV